MRYGVLGPLAVWDERGEPVTVPEVKVRALLAALLAQDGGPVPADRLIHDLWGDRPPGKPAGALQAKVSQLRRTLGRDRVVREPAGYRLRIEDAAELDADRFRDLVAQARPLPDPRARAALLDEALRMWRGDAYADFADEEFARPAVDRLTEQRLSAVEEHMRARLESGDHALVADELAAVVARHPLRERLRAVHVQALYLAGRQGEALASYDELRTRLAGELGVDPSPALRALHVAMLRQDPGLVLDAPAVAAPAPAARERSNLPVPLTALVGREQALVELAGRRRSARLVTLTGPGGVGKSRLAVESASRTGDGGPAGFPDGTWLVELAGVRTATTDDLAQLTAAALGVRDDSPADAPGPGPAAPSPTTRLAAALRDRRILLVLDNCEHVVDAAAALTESLLRTCPGLHVVVTSQEPLGITGELVFGVEPLRGDDAVRLFTERAAAAAPELALRPDAGDPTDAAAVEEICRRLDGIPLALELAATRVRALGVQGLAARLGDRFSVLGRAQRGAPARQQTLRAVIAWSWELLSAPERIVLRRLAVHSDGCDLAAAEAVCSGDGVARAEVLDLVTRLVERSLVVVSDGPAGPRYRLLESVAAYATERLREMEDLAVVSDRHLRHHLALAVDAEPRLRGAEQQTWLRRLDAEAGNLRVALDEAVRRASSDGADHAVRLVSALAWWWLLRGRLVEARRGLAAVLAVAAPGAAAELTVLLGAFALLTGDRTAVAGATAGPVPGSDTADPVRRARGRWLCAYGLFSVGETAASAAANELALDAFTAAGDRWGEAAALGLRASLSLARSDFDALDRDGRRSAALFRDLGDRWGELQTISPLAVLAEIRGDYDDAGRRQREGLAIARELGLQAEVAARLSGLGRLALLARRRDEARDLHRQALRLSTEQGYAYGRIHAEMGLALGARRDGDLDAAEAHLHHIRDHFAGLSSPAGDHLLLAELGFIAELRGAAGQAAEHHLHGLDVARSLRDPRAVALSLEGLAGAAAAGGGPEGAGCAARLLGAADRARRSVGSPLPPAERGDVDRVTAAARAVLGAAGFSDLAGRGARATAEETVRHVRAALGWPGG